MPDADVRRLTDRFLAALDRELPGVIEGVYLVGSVALDDYRPGLSDVDFIAVSAEDPGDTAASALRRVQQAVTAPDLPVLDGIFVTWHDLAARPQLESGWAHFGEGEVHRHAGFDANPPQWRTLARHGVTVRGPAADTLKIDDSDEALQEFCWGELRGYWLDWARSARGVSKTAAFATTNRGLVWGGLAPARLHCAATTGAVISKGASVPYVAGAFDGRFTALVARARRVRDGGRGPSVTERWHQRHDLAAFIEHLTS